MHKKFFTFALFSLLWDRVQMYCICRFWSLNEWMGIACLSIIFHSYRDVTILRWCDKKGLNIHANVSWTLSPCGVLCYACWCFASSSSIFSICHVFIDFLCSIYRNGIPTMVKQTSRNVEHKGGFRLDILFSGEEPPWLWTSTCRKLPVNYRCWSM